jgi:hypothetical protein
LSNGFTLLKKKIQVTPAFPPGLTIGYNDFFAFLNLTATPHVHAQLARRCAASILEDSVGFVRNSSIVVDEAGLIPHKAGVDTDAQVPWQSAKRQIVVRTFPLIAVYFTFGINNYIFVK